MNDDWDDDSVSAPSQNPTDVSWNGSQGGSKPPAGRGRGASTLISQLNSVKISSDNGWGVGKSAANPVTGTNGFNSKTTNGDEWGAPAAVVPVKAPTNFDDSWGVTTPAAKLPAAAAPVKAPTNFDDSWGVAAPAAQAPAKPPTSFADSWGSAPPTSSTFKNSVEDQPRGGGWGSSTENSSAGGWKGGAGGGNRACHKCGEEGHMSRECPNGGGGGGGSRACFKCGDEGHMSRDCPTGGGGGGGGGGGSRACHKCGEEGHMSRECPKGGGGGKGCFKCGDEGHMSRDCPTGGSGGGGGSRACFKCGDEGHMSRDCPTGGGGGGGSRACHKCGEEGHMSRECPKGGGGGGGGRGCFKCGEEGHMSRECPTGGEGEGGGDKKCFKCHETGHMSKDCPNPFSDVTEDGKPRELYIPPEVTSDEKELFEGIQTGANFSRFDQIALQVTGDDVPQYITSFEDAGLRPLLLDNIRNSGYLKPTPVQKGSIAVILAKRDLIASAVTGSGKTAAYLVPVINILLESGVNGGSPGQVQTPEVVIIAPTRELAVQIHHESRKFSHNSTLKSVIIYGGTSVAHQRSAVQSGCNILVATAGRLKDFVERQFFDFSNVKFFILDEADRMLDMGFEKDIDIVARHSTMPPPGQRRTLMFSATFPPEVQQMAKKYLVPDYIFVTTGNVGGTNPDVYQEFIEVSRNEKRTKLMEVLTGIGDSKVIVFVESKKTADFIAAFLCNNQLQCTSIHGDRLQSQRESALREFKRGQRNVLVATNVAARGLDIAGVEYVINYDLPADVEEYVHRIGRTGRVGNTGKSISFFDVDKDGQNGGKLVEKLVQSGSDVPLFLQQYVSGVGGMGFNIHAPSMQSNFSSRDVRRFGDKHEKDDGRKIEAEETWD